MVDSKLDTYCFLKVKDTKIGPSSTYNLTLLSNFKKKGQICVALSEYQNFNIYFVTKISFRFLFWSLNFGRIDTHLSQTLANSFNTALYMKTFLCIWQ